MTRDIASSHPRSLRPRSRLAGRQPLGGDQHPTFPTIALLALSAAIFLSMSSEFMPGGLLPQIGAEFDRPLAITGQLVTVFAAAVIVTATPLAILTRRIERKALAVVALSGIVAANVAVSFAPTFEFLTAARIGGGIAHGLFWSVAAAYAADLVPRQQIGRATAITAAGGSLSGVLGVPLGNALGQAFGWRAAFATMAVLGVVVLVVIIAKLPRVRPTVRVAGSSTNPAPGEPSSLGRIVTICVIILFVVIGQTSLGTYMVPWLTDVAGYPPPVVPVHLLVGGLAAFIGVAIVGRTSDRFPRTSLLLGIGVVLATDVAYVFAAPFGFVPVFVTSVLAAIAFAGVPVLLQARMMRAAAPHQRSLAASLQTTAFNLAIGGGAVVGGLALTGADVTILPWVAAGLTIIGLVIVLIVDAIELRSARRVH
jgi:DHA1 family inner membrane transport protein